MKLLLEGGCLDRKAAPRAAKRRKKFTYVPRRGKGEMVLGEKKGR